MEAVSTDIEAIVEAHDTKIEAAPAARATSSGWLIRGATMALVFSVAFSSSFVIGYYGLGPWIDTIRAAII